MATYHLTHMEAEAVLQGLRDGVRNCSLRLAQYYKMLSLQEHQSGKQTLLLLISMTKAKRAGMVRVHRKLSTQYPIVGMELD